MLSSMRLGLLLAFALTATSHAQWDIQNSGTIASLRGIHSVGKGIAWASGTNGTVLRTEDGGYLWQRCTTPPGADKLDFRGIQAFDANTAIVMSSGKGDLSRIYKTTDGCQTWTDVFDNPDETGFFDSILLTHGKELTLLGDPVAGRFAMFVSQDQGKTWFVAGEAGRDADTVDGAFAASNSALAFAEPYMFFGTSAASGNAHFYRTQAKCVPPPGKPNAPAIDCTLEWMKLNVPLGISGSSSGIFSLGVRMEHGKDGLPQPHIIAIGGTYDKPNDSAGSCAISHDGGTTWNPSTTPPHGYRSAVAYDTASKTWITVGPNGTDISTDDGRNWRALTPSSNDTSDADKNWNALSLPFVVGSHGRIGVLNPAALKSSTK
jgi:photosystem II stability/assembly factor-like uncharacterized protein